MTRLTRLISALALATVASATAQNTAPEAAESPAPPASVATPSRLETVAGLNEAIQQASDDIESLRRTADLTDGIDAADLTARRLRREEDLDRLRRQFESVATGIAPDTFGHEESPDLDLASEIKDLLGPIVNELKRATTRPRELDRLAREIEDLRERRGLAEQAIERVSSLGETGDEQLDRRLAATGERWIEQNNRLTSELQIAEDRRQRLLGERKSVYETVESLTQVFFRSRGRNLALAALAFVFAWLLVRGFHLLVQRLSPLHGDTRRMVARVIDLVFVLGATIAGTLAAMAVLYSAGDWVLLTVFSLFLVGLAWASRTALPRIWRQLMILMNLGGVREGERILIEGIPYRVERLGFYTYLRNPALTGGVLRLPLTHIADLHTRPFGSDERWFPTNPEDWVLVSDTHGKVVSQSPDLVTLIALGGARMVIPSRDFIQQSPIVLSAGFRISITFGVDYQHQAIVTTDIPAALEATIRRGLGDAGITDKIRNLQVEFESAGSSSLDIAVLADFRGETASNYRTNTRLIQRLCVDACNENGWVIPFTQLTLHMATPLEVEGTVATSEPSQRA